MSLLLQLNGDLPSRFPGHERRLYLFSCRRKACRRKEGSISAIRGNRISKVNPMSKTTAKASGSEPRVAEPADIGAALFGGTATSNPVPANPFSSASTMVPTPVNPFASASSLAAKPAQRPADPAPGLSETFAAKARLSAPSADKAHESTTSPHEPWPSDTSFPKPYTQAFLDAEYETLDQPPAPDVPAPARLEGDVEMGEPSANGSGAGGEDKQLFESSMDKTFQRFADRLAQNPEQVLRYEFGSQPLLYSSTDAVGKRLDPQHARAQETKVGTTTSGAAASKMPRCQNCGAQRVFEVQLVPHAITVLEEDEDVGLDGMDWGTVILGVCENDCSPRGLKDGEVGYLEEWVGVQWEELVAKKAEKA